jgi:hypothetical protein
MVNEQTLNTSNNTSSSIEDIVIDAEPYETNVNSEFYSSEILLPVMIDFDLDNTVSTGNTQTTMEDNGRFS